MSALLICYSKLEIIHQNLDVFVYTGDSNEKSVCFSLSIALRKQ